MGRVIAAKDFQRAVDYSLENRFAIGGGAQWRIHFEFVS